MANLAQYLKSRHIPVSRAAISQWETGETEPSRDKLDAVLERYQISYDWLINGKGPPPVLPAKGRPRKFSRTGERGMLLRDPLVSIGDISNSQQEWLMPAYVLPTAINAVIYHAATDLPPIKHGDHVLIDRGQSAIGLRGIWLVEMPKIGLILVRSRVAKQRQHAVIEVMCPDDAVFSLRAIKKVIGRAVRRFTSI